MVSPRRQAVQRRTTAGIHPPAGFTLVEVIAVLVLIALAAGTVAVSVRGHVAGAQLEMFLDRLETLDAQARNAAKRHSQSVALTFDMGNGQVSQAGGDAVEKRTFAAPGSVAIAKVRTNYQQSTDGTLQINVSPLGQTDTYALRLQAASGRSAWLVVLGVSGQCLRFDEERDVEEIFSLQSGTVRGDAG